MAKLNSRTHQLIEKLFPTVEPVDVTCRLLEERGQNPPFQKDTVEYCLERIRCTALKISNGDALKVLEAIELAKRDGRDLLMWAGFGNSLSVHEEWAKSIFENSKE